MLQLLYQGQVALFLAIMIALIISLSCHEFGHAWSAHKFGDDTAKNQGRLTLNPIAHIDPMGLLMIVFIGFGYARPVPTNPRNYNSRWAQMVVAAAGPAMNLVVAVVAINLYQLGMAAGWSVFAGDGPRFFFTFLALINLILMLFNLIPVGPLDGHYIAPYLLPAKWAKGYAFYNAKYGSLLLLGLVVLSILGVPVFRYVWDLGQTLLPWISFF
jgi:Zn-dependent protease